MALKDRIVCFQSTASLYWFRLLSCDVLEQTLYEYHPAICWMCPGNSECIAQLPIVFAVQLMVVLNFSAHVQTSHVELCTAHKNVKCLLAGFNNIRLVVVQSLFCMLQPTVIRFHVQCASDHPMPHFVQRLGYT